MCKKFTIFVPEFVPTNTINYIMKRISMVLLSLVTALTVMGAGINYDGTTLTMNNNYTRTQCGTMSKNTMQEVSGFAASRTTPGYLWAHSDENTGSNKKIIAVQPSGTLAMTVKITGDADRDDWEDIATGVYNNTNYLFIGAFGDNNHEFNDQYYIYYLPEPAIVSGTQTLSVNYIRFGYPDNQAHNTETLMYDNAEQMIYIVDKVEGGACALYKLPFSTDYGTGVQRLTKVCNLGSGSAFELCCGGDISPDGKFMAVKNQKYILLWERQGSESLSVTATRRPTQIAAYQKEEQGESLAWADSTTFYTTSDSKKDTPIYQYVRNGSTPPDEPGDPDPEPADSTLKAVNEVILTNHYSAYINDGETVIRGWYLAGEETPIVAECVLSAGATWAQNGNMFTVTALDGSSDTYTLDIQPVTPLVYTDQEIVFDGSEGSWLKSAYGWDDSKKWKYSKTDEDYSREIAGKTHIEMFLPACDTLVLTPFTGTERKVQFYINGEAFGSSTKFVHEGLTLAVEQAAPFMLTIASAQSSGDGGVAALRMARRTTTGLTEDVESSAPVCRKVLRNGQIFIIRDGQAYTLTGIRQKEQ